MRKTATLMVGALLLLGGAAFLAPGVSSAQPPNPCDGDGAVHVSYVIDADDPRDVVAVLVVGIAEGCGTGLVKVTLNGGGEKLIAASSEHDGSASTQRIDLAQPVSASLIDEVQVVLGGVG